MATFLHTRRFLEYHGDRFRDQSVLVTDSRGNLLAVVPAATDPTDGTRVVSHPGVTFGGLIHAGRLNGEGVLETLRAVTAHWAGHGFHTLRYKPVPHIYHRSPSADDVWAMGALGAERTASGLSAAIDLAGRRKPSTRRARSYRKALRAGVTVSLSSPLAAFWPVLEAALERRYSARPVHTLAEIELLSGRFPDAIRLATGLLGDEVVAGVVLFLTPRVVHMQYAATSEEGMRIGALDAVLERCIALAADEGARYFDFGTSMEDRTPRLQGGLHSFKAEFGGGGVLYEQYDVGLAS